MKFFSDDYLQMYKILQLFTSLITSSANLFTGIKVIEITCTLIYAVTKVIKNSKVIKAFVQLKLFVVLGLMK
jgi:hypothetical protein